MTDEFSGAVDWAFEYFYHMDKANACMHTASVRFSPITFRLAEILSAAHPMDEELTSYALVEVMTHRGKYVEDQGR